MEMIVVSEQKEEGYLPYKASHNNKYNISYYYVAFTYKLHLHVFANKLSSRCYVAFTYKLHLHMFANKLSNLCSDLQIIKFNQLCTTNY